MQRSFPQPVQHGGDALVLERRGEAVHRALPGVRPDRRQFLRQHAPVRGERFDRVGASVEPGETGLFPDLGLDQVALRPARNHACEVPAGKAATMISSPVR